MSPRIYVVGSANIDIVVPVERLPARGETIRGGPAAFVPGGKGANQACAAARLGGCVSFVGQIGRDPFAAVLRASLASSGVDTGSCGEADVSTGTAWIGVLPDGDNSIIISSGANATLTPELALARLSELSPGDLVLLQWEISYQTFVATAEFAKSRGAQVILDPAPARPICPALPSLVDILTPNQSEAGVLLDLPAARTVNDSQSYCSRLVERGFRSVVVKAGEFGCVASDGGQPVHFCAYSVTAVDTTAAGDVFNGALAARLASGTLFFEAVAYANAAAAVSVTRAGAQPSIPAAAEVEHLLRENSENPATQEASCS